ncbi:glycosyltransferase family 4 protein [uncultured Prochlorococcus sp.]|uniref:glycosyltransferase family 4 protein n=1 Tax=uncultured Prochlorococcus sp. TaxID=159733 RepID=UPI00258392C5|nr:glycosyltransferase family 4 protein [uncultured Prochlorococcus sp.]
MVIAKKKLLFIVDSLNSNNGGAEISSLDLINRLSYEFYIEVLCFDDLLNDNDLNPGIVFNQFKRNNLISHIPRTYRSCINPFAIYKILKFLHRFKNFDVVILGNISDYTSYSTLPILKLIGIKTIHIIRDTMLTNGSKVLYKVKKPKQAPRKQSIIKEIINAKFTFNPIRRIFSIFCVNTTDLNITISAIMRDYLKNHNINSRFVHNGIEIADKNIRFIKVNHNNVKRILMPSRPSFNKGILPLAKLAKSAEENNLNFEFILTCEKKYFLKTIRKFNPSENLIFKGWINKESIKDLFISSDLIIYPSQYLEPFGRVPIEAMSLGIPVAVSNYGALPEIIKDGYNGLILNFENTKQCLKKINELFSNKEFQEKLISNGYETIERNFDIKITVKKYINLIYQVINAK